MTFRGRFLSRSCCSGDTGRGAPSSADTGKGCCTLGTGTAFFVRLFNLPFSDEDFLLIGAGGGAMGLTQSVSMSTVPPASYSAYA